MRKLFILNADDFGLSITRNEAIFNAHRKGFLSSTTLLVNCEGFKDAAERVVPQCPGLGVGIHLNIMEGPALVPGSSLTDGSGVFNHGFVKHLMRSGDKKYLREVEDEFRAQIEKGLKSVQFDHSDSHVHTHGIPALFKIAYKLTKEYGFRGIRTQHEQRYTTPDHPGNRSLAIQVNRVKIMVLNTCTAQNRNFQDGSLKTNDFIIGVGYTAMMSAKTVEHGLKKINRWAAQKPNLSQVVVEALFHPDSANQNAEYQIPFDRGLEEKIKAMGFEITNFGKL